MGEVVNLRVARKRKARADQAKAAEESRIRHGRTKAEKTQHAAEASRAAAVLDGHRRDKGGDAEP